MNTNKSAVIESLLEDLGMEVFGRSRELSAAVNQCICCGKTATSFRDDMSRREYQISKLCQKCQDKFFGGE